VSFDNPNGKRTNSDLEMAGYLLSWLCIEGMAKDLCHKHITLFSDNSPSVSWVMKMALRKSRVAAQLVRALALRLNIQKTCPLTPVQNPGVEHALTDIPSRSFGSVKEWECKSDTNFLTLFNTKFPLPQQASWTVFRFGSKMITRVISTLRMTGITLAEWQRLPRIGKHTGQIGRGMSGLWDWTLLYRGSSTRPECTHLPGSPHGSGRACSEGESVSRLERSLALSRPLGRRSRWCALPTGGGVALYQCALTQGADAVDS
jgi:hypothetical protein